MEKKSKVMLVIIIILLLLVVLFAIMLVNYRVLFGDLENGDVNNKVGLNNDNTIQSGTNLVFDNVVQNNNDNNNLLNDNVVVIGNSVDNNVIGNQILNSEPNKDNSNSEKLEKRSLTTEELDEIKKMIYGNVEFLWDKSFEEYPKLDVTEMVGKALGEARKERIVLDKIKYTYDEIWNIYENNGRLFAVGDVEYCTLNDIMKMYKSLFNKNISKEELLNQIKKEIEVNEPILYYEKEEIIIVDLGGGADEPYNILSSSYENGKYIVEISRNNSFDRKEYTFTGTIVFEKVDDRYCFNSYTYNNDKKYIY